MPNAASFRCRGNGGITATHDKTIEFTREATITRRATCVLGVSSDHTDHELLALRGDVEVVLECGDYREAFRATITPFFLGDDSVVLRRGPELRSRTFAYDASKTAADIDRALVHALADSAAELRVTVREVGRTPRPGALFVVAVPIGNDDDLSPRARRVLEAADVVLAEDTRTLRDLARRTHMNLDALVLSYHEHNEATRADDALERLHAGARVALVSDAGTPLCSDPGYVVVGRALEAGIDVSPVPGPSSLLAVLSASGLAVDRFSYIGFLPRRNAARRAELQRLIDHGETFVVHEAPHRYNALLDDLALIAPEWQVCAGREVTKIFEQFARGRATDLKTDEPRGEYTLVVAPPGDVPAAPPEAVDDRLLRALLAQGVTPKTLVAALAELPGVSHKAAYARVLALQ